ncbi:predicted protein [Postia placenta Mad-698-R]|nr:predicted protein [Postia placenta Mad-698-R]
MSFFNGGILFSSAVLTFIALISLYSFLLLVKTKFVVSGSFGDIGGTLYGPWMRYAILGSITISQVGFVSAYIIFVSENLQAFVLAVTNCATQLGIQYFILLQMFIFVPLALIRNLAKLSTTALVADAFILTGLIYIFGSEAGIMAKQGHAHVELFNARDWPLLIGTAVFSFEGIGLVIPITDAMKEPRKFPKVLTGVMLFLMVLFCGGGVMSYLTFGADVQTVVIVNLDTTSRFTQVVQLLYSLAIMLSVPLQLFPAVRIMENGLFERSGKADTRVKWLKNLFRLCVVIFCSFLSWAGAADLDNRLVRRKLRLATTRERYANTGKQRTYTIGSGYILSMRNMAAFASLGFTNHCIFFASIDALRSSLPLTNMDSEDERQYEKEEKQKLKGFYFPIKPEVLLRFYEDKEVEEKYNSDWFQSVENNTNEGEKRPDYSSLWRLRRFMRSFKKFHEGSLDLTGRSERRYSSLKSRMALFLEDVENRRRHSTRHEKRRQIIDQIVVEVDYKITPRSLLSEFHAKYKLSDVWLDELFREADEVKSLLLDGSTPVFQKLYLLDLPPELILHIMELSGVHGARHLAATCRSLRTVSLSYIYQSRRLVMEFSPTLRDANGEQLKREAAGAYARSHAQDMQKKLLKDAIFLLSRLDIIPRIQNLTIGVAWSQRHLEWAGIDIGTPEYTSFLRPVWAGFEEVLPRAVNVSNLYCMSVQLTQSLLTTMVGLPMLHTLKLHTCTVAIDQSLDNFPYLPQVVNVILAQTHDISDHSSLRCLRLFPNLRMLAVTGFTRQELGLLDEAFRPSSVWSSPT